MICPSVCPFVYLISESRIGTVNEYAIKIAKRIERIHKRIDRQTSITSVCWYGHKQNSFTSHYIPCRLISNSKHIRSASIVPCFDAIHRFQLELMKNNKCCLAVTRNTKCDCTSCQPLTDFFFFLYGSCVLAAVRSTIRHIIFSGRKTNIYNLHKSDQRQMIECQVK